MGLFDTVMVPCPTCGVRYPAQSKSGPCLLDEYDVENAPPDVMLNVNRHAPFTCTGCGTQFSYVPTEPFGNSEELPDSGAEERTRRLKAWETRRAKYGAAGHAGSYRTGGALDEVGHRALAFLLGLYAKAELSEGQCCKALGLDRVSFRELVDTHGGKP